MHGVHGVEVRDSKCRSLLPVDKVDWWGVRWVLQWGSHLHGDLPNIERLRWSADGNILLHLGILPIEIFSKLIDKAHPESAQQLFPALPSNRDGKNPVRLSLAF